MAIYLDGLRYLAISGEVGPQVPLCVGAKVGDDRRGWVIRQDDALGAEEAGQQGWKGGAGAELDGGYACDVEGCQVGGTQSGLQRR